MDPMSYVGKIEVIITTADKQGAGTNGEVYLGIGRREFLLNIPGHDAFKQGQNDTFIIGDGSNVKNSNSNVSGINNLPNRPTAPGENSPVILFVWLDLFPTYIRFNPLDANDNWNIEEVYVKATKYPEKNALQEYYAFGLPVFRDGSVWLGKSSGLVLHLIKGPILT
jgi:hypothetical protein